MRTKLKRRKAGRWLVTLKAISTLLAGERPDVWRNHVETGRAKNVLLPARSAKTEKGRDTEPCIPSYNLKVSVFPE